MFLEIQNHISEKIQNLKNEISHLKKEVEENKTQISSFRWTFQMCKKFFLFHFFPCKNIVSAFYENLKKIKCQN